MLAASALTAQDSVSVLLRHDPITNNYLGQSRVSVLLWSGSGEVRVVGLGSRGGRGAGVGG